MINVLDFSGDPWTVPQPYLGKRTRQNTTEMRIVWYCLLHTSVYPVQTNDIYRIIQMTGEQLSKTRIAVVMRRLCECGYFTRWKPSGWDTSYVYRYAPTSLFDMVQAEYLEAVA